MKMMDEEHQVFTYDYLDRGVSCVFWLVESDMTVIKQVQQGSY